MADKNDKKTARELVRLAKALLAEDAYDMEDPKGDEDTEVEDEGFTQKVRDLRSALLKISRKKNMRLQKFGIGMIRPNAKVSDLVDALLEVTRQS